MHAVSCDVFLPVSHLPHLLRMMPRGWPLAQDTRLVLFECVNEGMETRDNKGEKSVI